METKEQVVERLLKALMVHRHEYVSGKICSLTWVKVRLMVMREADFLGVTSMMLDYDDTLLDS